MFLVLRFTPFLLSKVMLDNVSKIIVMSKKLRVKVNPLSQTIRRQQNTGKYKPEETPYLDTFHAVC